MTSSMYFLVLNKGKIRNKVEGGVIMVDVLKKLQSLIDKRGWSMYRLAQECGLNESTILNIFRRNTIPTIPTLESICSSFGITLSQFFAENDMIELTPDVKELLDAWQALTPEQKEIVLLVARSYHHKS